ncbi:hypothetical protein ACT7DH_03775 [Bacillus pacificus]
MKSEIYCKIGKVIATKEVTAENDWKYEFGKLPTS